ncbi:D-mandelate dehydrogenase-like protein [Cucurbitaria berberidis CBS 394.84]|uniref:D-mandelate dehydrogenase-like protein n=1 Tax=Cucurbitaria berberidis CBS 394.84 TaxID=1168544 RepID=A0A9P4GI89_9PLEO|nr:D-mandelate dehydrogenase-like protein [Cucurbitaria berberidis CBS 394.84]KAF1846075.1 D-mandelate dehydrogenase-like protein [Cucurbitaria berberidis CBS 394.84]
MSAETPTPQDSGLPPPPAPNKTSSLASGSYPDESFRPTILHLGDDIRWNHRLYVELTKKFKVERTYSIGREDFKQALKDRRWGDFVGIYRPFWNTGGEMGNWDKELIDLLPKSCKIYASAGAGFDWVDTRALAQHGTIYCNSASACTESVADAAIVLILSCYRAIAWSFLAAQSCDTEQFQDANQNIAAVTHNPNGTVLGIVGLGRIGMRIAEKATRAFEMKIVYHDVVRMEEREEQIGAGWCATLDELLQTSDCVLLATPFNGEVLLSTPQFAKFKPGARLVNIARGKLVDEDALSQALDDGVISAAGLDVHANEPNVNPKLVKKKNVMALSHTAGASVESHIGFERLGMENLLGWLEKGESGVVSPVNLQWLKRD